MTLDAGGLRAAFTGYFTERGHVLVESAGLIPHHPLAPMFTNAGMNQFLPYFVGEETPPFRRATSVQRCVRVRGKHDDVELIGRTTRHGSFFEMLGNFSFGDYFKKEAIAFAWELLTKVLGLDPDRLWVTVHVDDDEAAQIWTGEIGLASERLQRMGPDNFWEMAETGPCGPSSEIYYDRGAKYGADGGPAGGGEERFLEVWNLVFMQYSRQADGRLEPLPAPNIDTGAGLERLLTVLEDAPSVWETTLIAPLVARAAAATGASYGGEAETDVALRVIADHARTMAFLISDGVAPSNEGRGYVLRRIIRRAVLRAQQLAPGRVVLPSVVESVIEVMESAYPALRRNATLIETTVRHEEKAFRRTLRQGSALLEEALASGGGSLSGEVAFLLHDTHGFPIDLTVEIAGERGVTVDLAGFEAEMESQRHRARTAGQAGGQAASASAERWSSLVAQFGPTRFVGYGATSAQARVLAILPHLGGAPAGLEAELAEDVELVDLVLDVTPFYAEGGGQVGDTGWINGPAGRLRVLDTVAVTEGLISHVGYLAEGEILPGEEVDASIDVERRDAIRRNHTATHLLQAALRRVLGPHVGQHGSHVGPDRLRFDFNHFGAPSTAELAEVAEIVNREILRDGRVRTYETTKAEAESAGAIAMFGEKYGEIVRVVEAGDVSVELCGGTHVSGLGMIGPFTILSESSIGANTRRIEATTGAVSLEGFRATGELVERLAHLVRSTPGELDAAVERLVERERQLEEELRTLRSGQLREEARSLSATAVNGRLAARRDGLSPTDLRELALAVRKEANLEGVGLVGSPDGSRVAIVVATAPGSGLDARPVASAAAKAVGGGGGGTAELATAGGRDPNGIDEALGLLSSAFGAN